LFDPFFGVVLEAEEGRKIAVGIEEGRHPAEPWALERRTDDRGYRLVVHRWTMPRGRNSSQVGTHRGGYFSFQPLWDWIVAAEPDLHD
jgi:hypothetical protein